jgi:hypothetical protein
LRDRQNWEKEKKYPEKNLHAAPVLLSYKNNIPHRFGEVSSEIVSRIDKRQAFTSVLKPNFAGNISK